MLPPRFPCALLVFALAGFLQAPILRAAPRIEVPEGFEVTVAAAPPLVGHPMMACFDERGRLFIAESAGFNMTDQEQEQARVNFIRMIEDTDGDGVFDRSTIFADRLMIPNGVLWHKGALYVAEPPGIWRFSDDDGDGVADRREHIAARVRSNGMSSTLHGPVLGPTGRLFWCSGQMGYSLDKDGELPPGRTAPGVFALKDDGSEHEIFAVGGLANPVEVAFSAEGEVFGTLAILDRHEGQRRDGLLHWVHGGTYNISANDPNPLRTTGAVLPPINYLGQTAPAGIARYRGTQFGPAFTDNLFFAEFNTRRVVRAGLERVGATFRSAPEDFLVCDDVDFHPTDVVEDADGSLLVVDTGGWFRHGCPTSQIAKPEVKGAIYRVRRTAGPVADDPRGLKFPWDRASPGGLAALLGDPRPAVEERAVARLAEEGDRALPALKKILRSKQPTQARRNAVWALARVDTPAARALVRGALDDRDASVRQSATHAAGMARDAKALRPLLKLVVSDEQPSIRREAATALGRLRDPRATQLLLEALRPVSDPFLTHSLIYALIQSGNPAATARGLADPSPRTRRGALIALSQMEHSSLESGQVLPLLRDSDAEVRKAAFTIAGRRGEWLEETAVALRGWLAEDQPGSSQLEVIQGAVIERAQAAPVQQAVASALADTNTSPAVRRALLGAMGRVPLKQWPEAWTAALAREIQQPDLESRLLSVETIRERGLRKLDSLLLDVARNDQEPAPLRVASLTVAGPHAGRVDASLLDLALGGLKPGGDPVVRLASARALTALRLSGDQLAGLAAVLPDIDALALPSVLRAFTRSTNEQVGLSLVESLGKTPAADHLSADELARILGNYPESVRSAARPLLQRLGVDPEEQRRRLEELVPLAEGGDFSRGKQVFFGQTAACSTCHRVSGQGGMVGPNLSQIGKIRTVRDLIESILYPNASIVQGYHTIVIETSDGQEFTGVITRQAPDAVWIRGSDLAEHRVEAKNIASMAESPLSIMPAGLEGGLTREELRDLLAFLKGLK